MTEWSLREAQTKKYPRIHHYCWYGRPVFHSVRTPPEESLAVIHAEPKYPSGSAKYRITSILNRAMTLVDPVIVDIDRFDYDLWDQSGSDLIKSVNGRVRKLYSPHGQWMKIGLGNDFAIVDLTETERWDSSKVLFGPRIPDPQNRSPKAAYMETHEVTSLSLPDINTSGKSHFHQDGLRVAQWGPQVRSSMLQAA
ncbi:unnamed protein product [Penicillium bialowiezense]